MVIEATFSKLGGVQGLIEWAAKNERNRGTFYRDIWSKLIPKNIELDATITHDIASRLLSAQNKARELAEPRQTLEFDGKGQLVDPANTPTSVADLMIQGALEEEGEGVEK